SGPAGMTAALNAARSNLTVGIIEQGAPGGQMNNTFEIENYPGYDNISGPELSMKMYEPLEKFKVVNMYGIVLKVEVDGDIKRVITEDASYEAKTIVLATGAKYRLL
ncbi:FAD-dependent oxidoreductase, partial [Streptococcus suis]